MSAEQPVPEPKRRRLPLLARIVLYLILVVLVETFTLTPLHVRTGLTKRFSALIVTIFSAISALGVFGVSWVARTRIDREPWNGLALSRFRPRDLGLGFLLGVAMMGIVIGVEGAAGWLRYRGWQPASGGAGALVNSIAVFTFFAAIGFTEELQFRGYIFQNLAERFPIWSAILVSGLLFGLIHFPSPDLGVSFVVSAVILTTFLVLSRLLTGSLWLAIGWHCSWDLAQTLVFGLREVVLLPEGGSIVVVEQHGPPLIVGRGSAIEGGLLSITLEALVALCFFHWAQRRGGIPWRARLAPDGKTVSSA